jgi:GT2 family glycosyltransferase
MLIGIEKRYQFEDRHGNSIDIAGRVPVDQYGNRHPDYSPDLTSIVIISAERGEQTFACVQSIFDNTPEPFEIIISDVGSGEETQKIIRDLEEKHANLHVIYNKESTGTTGQRNQGIYLSKGGYIAFLDNDVLVLPEWLKHLRRIAIGNPSIGLVGAKLLAADVQSVYYCGIHTVALERNGGVYGIGLDKRKGKSKLPRHDELALRGGFVPWYTTTTILSRREMADKIGGFDDIVAGKGIFIANEDKDLSLTCRKMGFQIYYCPEAETIHNHDYSNVDRSDKYHRTYRLRMEQITKDTIYFVQKWNLRYMLEILPHEDNTREWNGKELVPVHLDLASSILKRDLVTIETLNP